MLHLHNSLSRSKELFTPLDPKNVTMYVCGPTVYDRAHLGNARAVVVFDTLYRLLLALYPKVTYARNITDVDDKINNAAREQKVAIEVITERTTKMFHEDMAALGCLPPVIEPRATTHIPQMISLCEELIAKNHAYVAEGHVLFHVASYAEYGRLSGRSRDEMIAGARVEIAPYKKDPADFVLWKPSSDQEPGWESPWGRGRPGWHIECSAMSATYLGDSFDIHGGGADLQFPHHENEIAQSRAAHPHSHYAKYWVHNGFLTVNGEKMSKSLGNFITLREALESEATNKNGQVIRLVFLSTHYRKPLDWTEKAVQDARKTLDYFYQTLAESVETLPSLPALEFPNSVLEALKDDLNTPKALVEMQAIAKEVNKETDPALKAKLGAGLLAAGKLIGLFYSAEGVYQSSKEWFGQEANADIDAIILAVKDARARKDFATADAKRAEATALGYVLEYRQGGEVVAKKG